MAESLTRARFSEWVGSTFRFHHGESAPTAVELVEVQPLASPAAGGAGRHEPFSLVFRGPGTFHVPQKIYRLEHDTLGDLEIFLVPIGPDDRGMRYQAVFN